MPTTPTTVMTLPFANGHIYKYVGTNADDAFFMNISETTNAGNAGRPNLVWQIGTNLNQGGGPVVSGETAFGMGIEAHYEPTSGQVFKEWHLYYIDENGVQHRPDSMRLEQGSSWIRMMHFTQLHFFNEGSPYQYATFSQGGFSYRTTDDAYGVPTHGIAWEGDEDNFHISRLGNSANLNFGSWLSINFGGANLGGVGQITGTGFKIENNDNIVLPLQFENRDTGNAAGVALYFRNSATTAQMLLTGVNYAVPGVGADTFVMYSPGAGGIRIHAEVGDVDIYAGGVKRMSINKTTGAITIPALAGSGSRTVVASSTGVLSAP